MPQDILLDDEGDLLFKNGDLVIGESTRQHQRLLLGSEKGEFREFPTHCVGVQNWINDDVGFPDILAAMKREFERDGMRVSRISLSENGVELLVIEASYET